MSIGLSFHNFSATRSLALRLRGLDDRIVIDWLDVNLQDEESEAKAALYRAQARAVEEENGDGDL